MHVYLHPGSTSLTQLAGADDFEYWYCGMYLHNKSLRADNEENKVGSVFNAGGTYDRARLGPHDGSSVSIPSLALA